MLVFEEYVSVLTSRPSSPIHTWVCLCNTCTLERVGIAGRCWSLKNMSLFLLLALPHPLCIYLVNLLCVTYICSLIRYRYSFTPMCNTCLSERVVCHALSCWSISILPVHSHWSSCMRDTLIISIGQGYL